MRRKKRAPRPSAAKPKRGAKQAQPLKPLTAEQRSRLPYSLPAASLSEPVEPTAAFQEDDVKPSHRCAASSSDLTSLTTEPSAKQEPNLGPEFDVNRRDSYADPLKDAQCQLWASSADDMRQCDPFFPAKKTPIAISRSGFVTALVLHRQHLECPLLLDTLVVTL